MLSLRANMNEAAGGNLRLAGERCGHEMRSMGRCDKGNNGKAEGVPKANMHNVSIAATMKVTAKSGMRSPPVV